MWFLFACAAPDTEPAPDADACDAAPEGRVTLPADDGSHDEPVEWWYWTGHLQDGQGRWYGFEEVFFLLDYGMGPHVSGHAALTDVDAGTFDYDVTYEEWDGHAMDDGFAFDVDGWTAAGGDGTDALTTDRIDLSLTSTKPAVLEHGDGYTDYDFGGYTFYYSRTRMAAEGTVTIDGEPRDVEGTAWFDHQWGDLFSAVTSGWDWFALQLDDGREVMAFSVRADGVPELVGGTLVGADCTQREVDVGIEATGEWTNAEGCTYPSGWTLTVEGETFEVTPVLQDQELQSDYESYWEGAATVGGDASGRAYVELTGYCG
jgi:predicted secreted hydrolase